MWRVPDVPIFAAHRYENGRWSLYARDQQELSRQRVCRIEVLDEPNCSPPAIGLPLELSKLLDPKTLLANETRRSAKGRGRGFGRPFTSESGTAAVRKSWELTTTPEQRERRLMPLKTRPPPDGSKSRA
jgi:hypothetical protein